MEDIQRLTTASCSFILLYTMVSKYIQSVLHIPDPISAMIFGMCVGREGLGFLDPHNFFSKQILSRSSRILLCLQTMIVSLTLPKSYIFKQKYSIITLVIILGILKCVLIFLILKLFSSLPNAACWAIAASLTPTDPVLSSSIIKGEFAKKNVPEKLRVLLNAESGINDGLGILMLNISTYILKTHDYKTGLIKFSINSIGLKCIISGLIGYILGFITKSIARKCCGMETLKSEFLSIHTFSLSFLALGLMDMVDGSELICIFFIGTAMNRDGWYTLESTNKKMAEIVESLFTSAFFVFIGALIEFERFSNRMIILNLIIILFIRIITLFIGYKTVPLIDNIKEAMFIGWFGPVGVGALYYSTMYDIESNDMIIDFIMCSVIMSTVFHGLSVPLYCLFRALFTNIKQKIF